jgi:hypothetical protein
VKEDRDLSPASQENYIRMWLSRCEKKVYGLDWEEDIKAPLAVNDLCLKLDPATSEGIMRRSNNSSTRNSFSGLFMLSK